MEIVFNWIGGATFIVTAGNLKIAVDPVLCTKGTIQDFFWFKSERLENPVYTEKDFDNIDMWLITHNHEDHLDSIGLSKISKDAETVCNINARKPLEKYGVNSLVTLKWGQKKKYSIKDYEIIIEAIPAIHGVSPVSAFFAGNVNGYFVTINNGSESKTIYITGDTVYTKRIKKAIKKRSIDLMIPNMGAACEGSWLMTLTLNSKMLGRLIADLSPGKVIPVHYGTFKHYKEQVGSIEALRDKRITIVQVGKTINIKSDHSRE